MYDQIDGVAMGSPLGPALANLFMGHYESRWLQNDSSSNVMFYRRYVDDIFCVFKNEEDVDGFFEFINNQHPNIRLTVEKEVNGKLPFLDVLIELSQQSTFKGDSNCNILIHHLTIMDFSYRKRFSTYLASILQISCFQDNIF